MLEPHTLFAPGPLKEGSRENQAGEGLEGNCLFVQLHWGFSILNLIRKPNTICGSLLGTLATP